MQWYNKWFGTRYYDVLYNHRDDTEAQEFIDNLIKLLKPTTDNTFLDLACGKGRHAVYLNSRGFDVTGTDLSENNICFCKESENDKLHFYVHDMRRIFRTNDFDFVFNLFTSFGYFERLHHNQMAIDAAAMALKQNGILVVDFFNAHKILKQLSPHHIKTIGKMEFDISKKLENGYIVKEIKVKEDNMEKFFYERVQALMLEDFEKLLTHAKLKILNLYGDYQLNAFDAQHSERLIIIAQKQ